MSDCEKYWITVAYNNYWPPWLREQVRKRFPQIDRVEFENEDGFAYDCTRMNRHDFRSKRFRIDAEKLKALDKLMI